MHDITIHSYVEAYQKLPFVGRDSSVVSIGNPGTPTPSGFNEADPHHLRFHFHDYPSQDSKKYSPPKPEDVQRLIESADTLFKRDRIFCHCWAGISRSSASAFVLKCMSEGIDKCEEHLESFYHARNIIRPHRGIVVFGDRELGADGQMIQALDEFTERVYGDE